MTWLEITIFFFGGFLSCSGGYVIIYLYPDRHKADVRVAGPAQDPYTNEERFCNYPDHNLDIHCLSCWHE